MTTSKSWYKYTDESGHCWRIHTTNILAEIGALEPTDAVKYNVLPRNIKPRYVWLQENPRPQDRLPARQKVIIERERLKYMLERGHTWQIAGKQMTCRSYYGEQVKAEAI